jgi:hypothetical protein
MLQEELTSWTRSVLLAYQWRYMGSSGRKYRAIPFEAPKTGYLRYVLSRPNARDTVTQTETGVDYRQLEGSQVTDSENHPEWRTFHQKGLFIGDLGGDFTTRKRYAYTNGRSSISFRTVTGVFDDGSKAYTDYGGPFLAVDPYDVTWPPYRFSSDEKLAELGTTAIARCSPSNPTIDLTTTLGELFKEGLPKLIGSAFFRKEATRAERRKAIGGEYLNAQFGYRPLADDLAKIASLIVDGDKAIEQYRRDAGKLVRRSYDFPVETSDEMSEYNWRANPFVQPAVSTMYDFTRPDGRVVLQKELYRRRWFKGAFTYVLPPPDSSGLDAIARSVIEAKKALGVRLTPAAIWNLTPWSWAADWFSNASDYLENLDAWIIDGQVLRYGYMMEHTLDKYTYHFLPQEGRPYPHKLKVAAMPASLTVVTETKIRRGATPYGFGLTWDGLTAFQQSILGALGLSRGNLKKNRKMPVNRQGS